MARASRVALRPPVAADGPAFAAAVRRSRDLHRPWAPSGPETAAAFRQYLARMAKPGNHAFLVTVKGSDEIAGFVNLTNVIGGVFRSGFLGYCAFSGFEHQGYMHEGVSAVVRHAFSALKLHRLEANIQPGNDASLALARVCGFTREGFSPRYLKIGGRWRDHERWAIVKR
ncbi:MAG: GNAT family N-acetyltransferase [Vicinamibacterales bacterium]